MNDFSNQDDCYKYCSDCECFLDKWGCCPNYCEEKEKPLPKIDKPFPPKLAILFDKKK